MKYYLLSILFFVSCMVTVGELSKDDLKRLREVDVAGIREDTVKNDDREKSEVLAVNTFQNEDDDGPGFRMRVVIELTDKAKTKYLVQFTGDRPDGLDSEYTGEDYWAVSMPHGELDRLKITGYLVQYGFMDDDTFILLAEEEDDSEDMLEGVRARTTRSFPGRVRLKHYYMFIDETEGMLESMPQSLRAITAKK